MKSKIVNREITNIIANYLYNHPLPAQSTQYPPAHLSTFRNINRPLDAYLRSYFSAHKYLGST